MTFYSTTDEGTQKIHKKVAAADEGTLLGHFLFASSNALFLYNDICFLHKTALYKLQNMDLLRILQKKLFFKVFLYIIK